MVLYFFDAAGEGFPIQRRKISAQGDPAADGLAALIIALVAITKNRGKRAAEQCATADMTRQQLLLLRKAQPLQTPLALGVRP